MNVNNGEIIDFEELRKGLHGNETFKQLIEDEDWVEVDKKDMTEKQKKTKKVSLKDHRSTLGKKLTKIRKERRIVNMAEPCPCGSGKKFKFCCRNSKRK